MTTLINFENIIINAEKEIKESKNIKNLESIRIKYLGKKSLLYLETKKINYLTKTNKASYGFLINNSKKKITQIINTKKKELELLKLKDIINNESIDVTLPGRRINIGNLHPISFSIQRIEKFFSKIGFIVVNGYEVENENYNFDYLNIPKYHPARTNNDTFWFDKKTLLRTQTSSMQIREMRKKSPPMKIITSGKVYRKDYDNLHTPMFHQVEGFVVDENINFANLKTIIISFLIYFFDNKKIKIRFRASYFPFTVPSAEVDILNNNGNWVEVLGCGMIHPKVLNNVNINSNIYSGFAFGIGIERLISLLYNIEDIRALFENDFRFLEQFKLNIC